MLDIIDTEIDLDADAVHTFAAGMRAVAAVDGRAPAEDALIEAFEADIPGSPTAEPDLGVLDSPQLKRAFLRSLVLVAFADGEMSQGERDMLRDYTGRLGLQESDLTAAVTHVASVLLSRFSGVKLYRDQVLAIGRELGLDEPTISQVLDSSVPAAG